MPSSCEILWNFSTNMSVDLLRPLPSSWLYLFPSLLVAAVPNEKDNFAPVQPPKSGLLSTNQTGNDTLHPNNLLCTTFGACEPCGPEDVRTFMMLENLHNRRWLRRTDEWTILSAFWKPSPSALREQHDHCDQPYSSRHQIWRPTKHYPRATCVGVLWENTGKGTCGLLWIHRLQCCVRDRGFDRAILPRTKTEIG